MKTKRLLALLLLLCCMGVYTSYAQRQNPYWPTGGGNSFHLSMGNMVMVPNIPVLPNYGAVNGVFECDGDLMFLAHQYTSINNTGPLEILGPNGTQVGMMGIANSGRMIHQEIGIVPVPPDANSDRRYMVIFMDQPTSTQPNVFTEWRFGYAEESGGNWTVSTPANPVIWHIGGLKGGGIAISRPRPDGSRFVYLMAGDQAGMAGELRKYTIDGFGNISTSYTVIASNFTIGTLWQVPLATAELELSHDGKRLAWGVQGPNGEVHALKLDNNGNYLANSHRVYNIPGATNVWGAEFTGDGKFLYVSVDESYPFYDEGIHVIRLDWTNNYSQFVPGTEAYHRSMIELGQDYRIYSVNVNGYVRISNGAILNTLTYPQNKTALNIPLPGDLYLLPDQIDGDLSVQNHIAGPSSQAVCRDECLVLEGPTDPCYTSFQWYYVNVTYNQQGNPVEQIVNLGTTRDQCIQASASRTYYLTAYNSCTGCTETYVMTIVVNKRCVAIGDCCNGGIEKGRLAMTQPEMQLSLFPNPAQDVVQLQFGLSLPAGTQLSVYGIDGRVLRTLPLKEGIREFAMTVEDLASGVYVLEVRAPGFGPQQIRLLKD